MGRPGFNDSPPSANSRNDSATRLGFGVIDQFCRVMPLLRFVRCRYGHRPQVTIDDIAAGIESTSPRNRKRMAVLQTSIQQEGMSLLLVRVHLEYLGRPRGRRSVRVCGFGGTDGPVYDVDSS